MGLVDFYLEVVVIINVLKYDKLLLSDRSLTKRVASGFVTHPKDAVEYY
jgi:hypothetical protein